MSQFVDKLIATANDGGRLRGVTTGEPGEAVRTTWAQLHEQARAMAGALVSRGLARHDAVAVLAAAPVAIGPAVQAVWLAGGSVWLALVAQLFAPQRSLNVLAVAAIAVAAILKLAYWRHIDRPDSGTASTAETATGLGAIGKVRLRSFA